VSSDLLEQFIAAIAVLLPKFFFLLALLFSVGFLLLAFTRVLNFVGGFVGSLINDISQGAAASMIRN